MKFVTVFVVALLAMNVAAYNKTSFHENHPEGPYYSPNAVKAGSFDFFEFCGRFYEFFKNYFQQFFQQFDAYFPADVKAALEKVFKYWPSFQQFYSPEFFEAVKDFFRAFANYYFPHVYKTVTELTQTWCKDLMPILAKWEQHVPQIKDYMQHWDNMNEKYNHTHY